MADVAAIILAAGGSSRFGRPKQLEHVSGRSLVQNAVSAAIEARCYPVVLVIGNEGDRVAAEVAGNDVAIAKNPNWHDGIASSIRIGGQFLREKAPETAGAVLMVCDQPYVTSKILCELIYQWRATGKPIVASTYSKTLGVPALFGRSCFDELLRLDGDSGAKPIIFKDKARVEEVLFPEGAHDIDTEEDLGRG
jgi:molybdenum cofactor cytidylyltransferase